MRIQLRTLLLLGVFIGTRYYGISQISITGPTCVVAGQSYQYTISGNWHASPPPPTSMTWTIATGSASFTGSSSGTPLPNVYITWTTSGSISLSTTNPSGNASLNVTVTTALSAGTISNTTQNINYGNIPGMITCPAATGGYCSPTYNYQWQKSTDNVNFTNISGETGQDILFNTGITQTTYYRRMVTETHGPTTGYSNTVTVLVYPQLVGGSISASSQTINFNTIPSQMTLSGVSGGTNSYTYQWQSSADASNWLSIPGATATTYTPLALTSLMYYRVNVLSNGASAYSSNATINVNPQLRPGTISPLYIPITSGIAPGPLTGITQPSGGGGCSGSYSYQWQSSTDGVYINYSNISGATSANYTPGTLTTNTWYRRRVICGTDTAYTAACQVTITSGTPDMNYVRVRDMLKAGVTDSATAYGLTSATDVTQSTQYFDGLGRPAQTVGMMQSPLQKDLVSFNVYDEHGRESVKYLPYASTASDGNYKVTAYTNAYNFNNTQFSGEQNYYSQVNYEPSPANRPAASFAPGINWVGASRGTSSQYLVNTTSDSVHVWTIAAAAGSIPTTSTSDIYSAGQLLKIVMIDESDHRVVEFKDKTGKVILKKVQLDNSPGTAHVGWLCTYYIYDEMDNLRFVVQPRCVELINGTWSINSTLAKEMCFRYEYDAARHLIIKKIPGAGEVWMVYDARDRLIMMQDSSLRASGKWMITEYDSLNRLCRTGQLTDANNRSYHQNAAASSISYPNTSTNYEVLTQTYYDDYTWVAGSGTSLTSTIDATYTSNSSYFNTTYHSSPIYAQQITTFYIVRGMQTGSMTKVIGSSSQYLHTVSFYDDRGKNIQAQTINYTGAKDILTVQYDFSGKAIRTLQQHTKSGSNSQSHMVLTKMNYNAGGRLLTIYKNIDNASSDQLIVTNTYDELGRLSNKADGNDIETMDYAYNIRGWLSSVNKNYLAGSTSNYFGFELGYDKTTTAVSSTAYATLQYNGNITGTIWKSKGDGVNRKFDFTYDNVNRLTAANFDQNSSGGTWDHSLIDFTVSNLSYDANGNILTMSQKGFKVTGSTLIDQMSYTYQSNSNKLAKVDDAQSDAATKLGDFHDGTNSGTDDYSYDGNGNLTLDNNKAISSITYNYLNLPDVITVTSKGTITYTYDAAGIKLKKTTVEGSRITTILYIENFVYQNDTLQFIGHEEGRARWAFHKYLSGGTEYKFEYDYFLKDHLGNVRMVLTQQKDTAQYIATMEAAYRTIESQLFYNLPQSNYSRSSVSGYPTDNTTNPNDSLMKLNGSSQKVGAAIVLKVMSGDVVDVAVKAYYASQTGSGTNSSITDVLSSFANGVVSVAGGAKGSLSDLNNTSTSPLFSAINSFASSNNSTISGKPRAYLNWILLDDQLQYVSSYPQSGAVPVGNYQTGTLNTLGYTGIPVTKNGFLYIYVNNETQGWDVFFDNLSVQHRSGPMTEETHYYPFGLTMTGISSKILKFGYSEDKYKFNGIEQNSDFDLNILDAFYRNLDPQIGRFWQPDPVTTHNETLYAAMQNNPISKADWLGDYFTWGNSTLQDTYKKLREENNKRMDGYMDELSKLDLTSTDKDVQKKISRLTTLINSHAELNSQWDEMENSGVEFYVSGDKAGRTAGGDTYYNVSNNRIDIRLGKGEKNIVLMAHEFRHGYGFLAGELIGTKDGSDPLYDIKDEVVANNASYLFLDRATADRLADGYYTVDRFADNFSNRSSWGIYESIKGKKESLTLNTAAAVFLKYCTDPYVKSYINRNSANTNLTIQDALNASNALDAKAQPPRSSQYIFGDALKNRKP
jgi:RHS repeat-associated protein